MTDSFDLTYCRQIDIPSKFSIRNFQLTSNPHYLIQFYKSISNLLVVYNQSSSLLSKYYLLVFRFIEIERSDRNDNDNNKTDNSINNITDSISFVESNQLCDESYLLQRNILNNIERCTNQLYNNVNTIQSDTIRYINNYNLSLSKLFDKSKSTDNNHNTNVSFNIEPIHCSWVLISGEFDRYTESIQLTKADKRWMLYSQSSLQFMNSPYSKNVN